MDQQIPLAVTEEPPSLEIFPPPVAVEDVTAVTAEVVRVARIAPVLKDFSSPYVVPALLIAYART